MLPTLLALRFNPDRVAQRQARYRGAEGLDPEFIKDLEKHFGFDKSPA